MSTAAVTTSSRRLAPSNTEIACALDACDRLVGVTDFDDHPAEVTATRDRLRFLPDRRG